MYRSEFNVYRKYYIQCVYQKYINFIVEGPNNAEKNTWKKGKNLESVYLTFRGLVGNNSLFALNNTWVILLCLTISSIVSSIFGNFGQTGQNCCL